MVGWMSNGVVVHLYRKMFKSLKAYLLRLATALVPHSPKLEENVAKTNNVLACCFRRHDSSFTTVNQCKQHLVEDDV